MTRQVGNERAFAVPTTPAPDAAVRFDEEVDVDRAGALHVLGRRRIPRRQPPTRCAVFQATGLLQDGAERRRGRMDLELCRSVPDRRPGRGMPDCRTLGLRGDVWDTRRVGRVEPSPGAVGSGLADPTSGETKSSARHRRRRPRPPAASSRGGMQRSIGLGGDSARTPAHPDAARVNLRQGRSQDVTSLGDVQSVEARPPERDQRVGEAGGVGRDRLRIGQHHVLRATVELHEEDLRSWWRLSVRPSTPRRRSRRPLAGPRRANRRGRKTTLTEPPKMMVPASWGRP